MKRALIIFLLTALVCGGCSAWQKFKDSIWGVKTEGTAQELAWDGMDAFEDGKYKDSIEYFQKLKDYYPYSKYAPLAELKIADAHFHLEQYEESIVAYEEFEKLHPRNEAIPYVIYQIGMCYFKQIDTIDRDQTPTRKALESFQRLQKQFPQDRYAHSSEEHITKCQKSMAGNEFVIGVYYFKSKHYRAALHRFMNVLSKYPDAGYHQKALEYIARCEESLAEAETESESEQQ